MNNVSLIGRLTANPELKHTNNDIATTRFSIAVDRPYSRQGEERQADFINIVAWRQTAEFVCKYFTKGQRIAITGQIRTGSYTDRDGNKRYTFDVQADNVEFCESKKDSGSSYTGGYPGAGASGNSYSQTSQSQAESQAPSYSNGSADDYTDMPSDDDLPF